MRITLAFLLFLLLACDTKTNNTDNMTGDMSAVSSLDIPIGAAARYL